MLRNVICMISESQVTNMTSVSILRRWSVFEYQGYFRDDIVSTHLHSLIFHYDCPTDHREIDGVHSVMTSFS